MALFNQHNGVGFFFSPSLLDEEDVEMGSKVWSLRTGFFSLLKIICFKQTAAMWLIQDQKTWLIDDNQNPMNHSINHALTCLSLWIKSVIIGE